MYIIFRSCENEYITENAGAAEFVLVFKITSVAPFQNKYRKLISAFF